MALAVLAGALPAGAVTFTNDTTIAVTNSAFDGQDIVVTNCTLTVDGPHSFASLEVLNAGKLTHSAMPNGQFTFNFSVSNEQQVLTGTNFATLNNSNVDMASIFVTDSSSTIVYTNGTDYLVGQTNNVFTTLQRTTNSAIPDGSTVLVSYNVTNPPVPTGLNLTVAGNVLVDVGGSINADAKGYSAGFGSGPGSSQGNPGAGSGGGHGGYGGLSASNAPGGIAYDLILQPADKGSGGGNGIFNGAGGAGGGAVNLSVGGSLDVFGTISVRGANGLTERSGGGAGGSIWLAAQTIDGSGSIIADGGAGEPAQGGGGGGGRIALYYTNNNFTGTILARGGTGYVAGGAGTIYTRAAAQAVGSFLADNGGRNGTNTLLSAPEAFAVTVQGGAVVSVPNTTTIGSLFVVSNGWVSLSLATLTVNSNVTVSAGGGIIADGTGSPGNSGVSPGHYANSSPYSGGGGGYGGSGASSALGQLGGGSYWPMTSPTVAGSGGGSYPSLPPGGAGGGVVHLTVNGTLSLGGRISSDGQAGVGLGSGGGSGGSVFLSAGAITGAGIISANGGAGNGVGGGGGGGRIAVYSPTNLFTGTIKAYGAGSGTNYGGAGTIVLQNSFMPVTYLSAQVIVDNGGHPGTNTSLGVTGTYDLTVANGAVVGFANGLSFNNLLVGTNSVLSIPRGDPTTITVNSNATIQSGGWITADAAGNGPQNGSGAGRSSVSPYCGSGASYGGVGAAAGNAAPGNTYDSMVGPLQSGSGGGNGLNGATYPAGSGGGSLKLNVGGNLAVNGKISADGGAASYSGASGGGSGGALWLTTSGTFSGTGTISASGGAGDSLGGGGGGGRIALYCQSNLFTGTIRAWGARSTGNTNIAGAGTVFLKSSVNNATPQAVVDNGAQTGAATSLGTSYAGTMDMTVQGGAVVDLFLGPPPLRNLVIASNSALVMSNVSIVSLSGDTTIQAGGALSADSTGFSGGSGQGSGHFASPISSGGGHGGTGGAGSNSPATLVAGGITYDSMYLPSVLGSGGGGSPNNTGGMGGGAIHLTISGKLTVDGRLSADGGPGTNPSAGTGSGGGSGGALWLSPGTLAGGGIISANGGAGFNGGGGGGGGRIAAYFNTNAFTGVMRAWGGGGSTIGGAGTIFTKTNNQSTGMLVVDNGGRLGTNTTFGTSSGGPVDLTVQGGGALTTTTFFTPSFRNAQVNSNGWFLITNSLTLNFSGNVTVQAGGGILADGFGYAPGSWPYAGGTAFTSPYGQSGGGGGGAGSGAPSGLGASGGTNGGGFATLPTPFIGGGGGAGGGFYPTNGGGAGGGAITMTVTGTLRVDGNLSSNGRPGPAQDSGGGAGGGVSLNVGTLAGAGTISANGGAGNGFGGGGGGGPVAVYFNSNIFAGTFSTHGGSGGGPTAGGAGTLYLKRNSQPMGQLFVDNAGLPGALTGVPKLNPYDLFVKGGAVVYPPPTGGIWFSNLDVGPGSSITCPAWYTNLDVAVLGNAIIETNGAIAVDGRGYSFGTGSGAGQHDGTYVGSGGGYGGNGGASSARPGGGTYGSVQQPVDLGSGGGYGISASGTDCAGGGALKLDVGGTLTLNGRLSAEGNAGTQDDSGGGAGGSIWVTTGALNGSGAIAADGGSGQLYDGGGGGGGRIAIYSPVTNFTGLMSAFGGSGYQAGQNGTIFFSNVLPALQVTAQTPTGIVSNGVSSVQLTFNAAVNPASFNSAQVSIATPNGLLAPGSLTLSTPGTTAGMIAFPQQFAPGDYTVTAGPQILDLQGNPMAQTYTGTFTISVPVIAGTVTDTNGQPVPGVLLQPDDGHTLATTDTNGNYVMGVPPGWTGTVLPSNAGFKFVPASQSYTNVSLSISNQNYLMVATTSPSLLPARQGANLSLSWYGIPGVTYQTLYSTDLVTWSPYGGTMPGSNALMQVLLPTRTNLNGFFRMQASY